MVPHSSEKFIVLIASKKNVTMAWVEPTKTKYHQVNRGFNHTTTAAYNNKNLFSM